MPGDERHPACGAKHLGQALGWVKTVGQIRQMMARGLQRVDQTLVLTMAAYSVTRMRMRTTGQIRLHGH